MRSENDSFRACPCCDQQESEPCWKKGSLQVVRCRRCGMTYANPVAEDLVSGSFYDRRPLYLSPEKLESDYAPVRFDRELRLFRTWCKAGSVLDVGCSTGGFLHEINQRYPRQYELLGTDVASTALDYAVSRGVPVTGDSFLDLAVGENRFDAITFWAVIEHLAYPEKFLSKAAQTLKRGAHCFILVPNQRSLAVRLLGLKYRYLMPEHLNYFTPATLRAFAVREPAFEVVASGSTHFNPVVIWQDWRSKEWNVSDEERARLLKRTTAWKQMPLLEPIKIIYTGMERALGWMNLADNLFVVLRKKS